ncbi:protein peste-like [Periplaneta americana]|uniref:protein peste-like n=1 Tax=Periplaneta americana TaxID=6978 RepID=UPI0037E8C6E9
MHRSSLRMWLGTALAITGLALLCSWNSIFEFTLRKQLALSQSSPLFEIWRAPPFGLVMNAFMFNLTNPHQFFDKDFKPEFEELGPYCLTERNEKVNVVWNDNYTVTYEIKRTFYYDEERSNGSLDDNITVLNAAPLSGSYSSRYWSLLSTFPMSAAIRMLGKSVLITRTFRELVLEGYEDPLLTMSNVLPGMKGKGKVVDKIGLIYERNGSTYFDGVLNLGTGADDINKVGTVFNWNYENKSSKFEGECGQLYGTTAEMFPPFFSRDTPLRVFIPEVCRSVTLEYLEDTEITGIPGYRYFMGEKNVDNGTLYPENWCSCGGECLPSGVINASSCLRDMPMFLSLPHFLYGDPYYREQVKGVSPPNLEKHLFHMTVEPTTGIPLDIAFRFQINLLLRNNPKISLYKDVPTILFPYVWLEKRFSMPADIATLFKWVLMMPTIGICFSIVLILLGLVILAFAVLPSSQRSKYQDENRILQNGKATKENLCNNQLQLEDNELLNSETKEIIDNEEKIKEFPPDVNRTTRL